MGFNPYFTGSLTATRITYQSIYQSKVFQSLFYWKSYCNEIPFRTLMDQSLFQSLFYWKSYCNHLKGFSEIREEKCFNPYFTGSLTATLTMGDKDNLFKWFQSLFYWKSYCNPLSNLLAKKPLTLCFNPYFTGSLTATHQSSLYQSLFYRFNPYFTGSLTAT